MDFWLGASGKSGEWWDVAEAKRTPARKFIRHRLEAAMETYADTRAAEITTALLTVGAGAAAVKQTTPGVMTLRPALAAALTQQAAVASFPLGASVGSVW